MLMDIKMPVMNGLEATKIIRESNTEIPIIMQTAYAFSSDKENAMNAGATEVLVKPITLSILRTTLSKYLPICSGEIDSYGNFFNLFKRCLNVKYGIA